MWGLIINSYTVLITVSVSTIISHLTINDGALFIVYLIPVGHKFFQLGLHFIYNYWIPACTGMIEREISLLLGLK